MRGGGRDEREERLVRRYEEERARINSAIFDLTERGKATAWAMRDRAEAKPGGTARLSNLVNVLFEGLPDPDTGRPHTSEDVAEWSRSGEGQSASPALTLETIEAMREGTPVPYSEVDLLEICDFFDVDISYFTDSEAPAGELDPPIAEARRWRAEHPDWPRPRFFFEDLRGWMAQRGYSVEEAADELGSIHPQRLRAILEGGSQQVPHEFRDAAREAIGFPHHVARERWRGRWVGNDLLP